MKTALLFFVMASVLGGWGCKVYDSALIEEGSAGVPSRPPQSTSSPEDDVEAVFALHNVSLDQSADRWRRFGLDLDGMNTASIEDPAECVAANGRPQLDGDNGIDNSFGQHVLPTMVDLISCMEDDIALNQGLGLGTLLIRLREWNGTANDAKVDVAVFSSVDGTSLDDVSPLEWGGSGSATLMETGGSNEAPAPAWDGEDIFFVDPSGLVANDLDRPSVQKTDAYVSKGRIVLPVDTSASFMFLTGPGSFSVSINGFLLADISADGQTLTKGLLAGRFSAGELVSTLGPLGICDESFRESIVALLTDNLDLRVDKDTGSANESCTATGVSLAFQGMRARIAAAVAPVALPIPDPCPDGVSTGVQPAFGRCCQSVAVETPELLPVDCYPIDLAPYENLPNPIPVPPLDGF